MGSFERNDEIMAGSSLRLLVITPEKTVVDQAVDSLRFPLFDGDMGVLPGRAPVVGRLGCGELRVRSGGGESRYFIDGGFLQIREQTVTLLTDRAMEAGKISLDAAEKELAAAQAAAKQPGADWSRCEKAINRARRLVATARAK